MFIREFPVIDSASSTERLNLRLKDTELEDYGEAFVPEFVYDAIRRLPRFSSMRVSQISGRAISWLIYVQRGHQQDAEEFLGFLLEEMHEECVHVMKGFDNPEDSSLFAAQQGTSEDSGWLEVGPKQKAAVTRSAGVVETESPITKIFGGKLRSELRVPGAKNSVTLEPYQPLQLDIGSPHINNITEALKGLTRSEILHGDFSSPRGPGVSATKQVFVETLPPVLILHLKRFQYDNAGGTQKVWKKVGYPLELEIPKELFPPHKRGGIIAHGGLPRYRLISVVYHHGKNASAGHYTVDMRRQNDREWIRLDDTIIRRVKSEDVAEAGGEEDPRILAAALEQHKRDDSLAHANIFDPMRNDNEPHLQSGVGWSQVNGNINNASKKWSGIINGVDTPTATSGKRTPVGHYSLKDNKVAYILFYQRMHTEF
jgi:ubiquitin carboxyl-terminal hydrolase 10